ncbi:Diuretic hormone receptor, partial [Schistosoma japonicum]
MTDITNKINIQRLLRSINYNETNKVNITYNQILCEQLHKQNIELQNKSLSYCPPYHDGATCWPPILAGTTVHMPCPSSYEGQMYNPYENATKECLEHGNWSSKSDYIPCLLTGDSSTLDLTMILRCIFLTGYSLSCGCLCLALIIFYIFKSLKCMRNTIHSHLFVALMIKACAWSISYIFVEFADIKQFKDDTKLTIS